MVASVKDSLLTETAYKMRENGESLSKSFTYPINSKIARYVKARKCFEVYSVTSIELHPGRECISGEICLDKQGKAVLRNGPVMDADGKKLKVIQIQKHVKPHHMVRRMEPFAQVNRQIQSLSKLLHKRSNPLTSLQLAVAIVEKRMMYIKRRDITFFCGQLQLEQATKLQTVAQNVNVRFADSPETIKILHFVLQLFINQEQMGKEEQDVKMHAMSTKFEDMEKYFSNQREIAGVPFIYDRTEHSYERDSGRFFVQELVEKELLLLKNRPKVKDKEEIREKVINYLFALQCKTSTRDGILYKVEQLVQTKYKMKTSTEAILKYVRRHFEDTDLLNEKADPAIKKTAESIIKSLKDEYEETAMYDAFQTCLEYPEDTIAYANHIFDVWESKDLIKLTG